MKKNVGISLSLEINPLMSDSSKVTNPFVEIQYSGNDTIIYETYDLMDEDNNQYQRKFKLTIHKNSNGQVTSIDKWEEIQL